jgi:hypothetical protein
MPMTEEMNRCIQTCLSCYRMCLGTAMNHCLETGGKHVEPAMPSMKRSRIPAAVSSASASVTPQRGKWPSIRSCGQNHRPAHGRRSAPALRSDERSCPCANASASVRSVMSISSVLSRDTFGGPVVIEKTAAGDDLEMGRVAHRPAQIGKPEAAKPRQGSPAGASDSAASISARKRRCASSATAVIKASRLGKCRNGAPGDTPARRAASRTLTASARPHRPVAAPRRSGRAADRHGDRALAPARGRAGRRPDLAGERLAVVRMFSPSITLT